MAVPSLGRHLWSLTLHPSSLLCRANVLDTRVEQSSP
jgi:hypothetical protein